jgi:hypothetical protein
MKLLILTLILTGCATQSIPIPKVEHNNFYMTEVDATAICENRAKWEQLPCGVVKIDGEICIANMHRDGSSDTVQCYLEQN